MQLIEIGALLVKTRQIGLKALDASLRVAVALRRELIGCSQCPTALLQVLTQLAHLAAQHDQPDDAGQRNQTHAQQQRKPQRSCRPHGGGRRDRRGCRRRR